MKGSIRLGIAMVVLAGPALAQTPVQTLPSAVTTSRAGGTITVTNTFQSIWVGQTVRRGCLVMNTSTNRQWVFFGPIASATKAESIPLEPASATATLGGFVSCGTGAGSVLQDQVSITGTSGDTFVANQQ